MGGRNLCDYLRLIISVHQDVFISDLVSVISLYDLENIVVTDGTLHASI